MNAEIDEEGNYNMIDGIPNNGFGEKKKSSLLEKLEHFKEVVGTGSDKDDLDRSL